MPFVDISRKIEFDAGHRIPNHKSKCKNFHGHRYILFATIRGNTTETLGSSDQGMVMDFGDVKTILEAITNQWDHAFLVWKDDAVARSALAVLADNEGYHKTVVVPYVPTVENMAMMLFDMISKELDNAAVKLHRVRLYETPNCCADFPTGGEAPPLAGARR